MTPGACTRDERAAGKRPRTLVRAVPARSIKTPPAALIQVFPAPRLGWAAISLPAKPEPILAVLLLMEELEHARPRQPVGQRGSLLLRVG